MTSGQSTCAKKWILRIWHIYSHIHSTCQYSSKAASEESSVDAESALGLTGCIGWSQVLFCVMYHATHLGNKTLALAIPAFLKAAAAASNGFTLSNVFV